MFFIISSVDEGEGSEVEEDTDDNDENSVNVGNVHNEKDVKEDDEKTGDTLGQKSQTDGTGIVHDPLLHLSLCCQC